MPKKRSAEDILSELYHAGIHYLQPLQWEFESDRWCEFLVCSWLVALEMSPEVARTAIASLRHLDILSPSTLAAGSPADQILIERVLQKHGATSEDASNAANLLFRMGQMTLKHWDGHIQRFLRAQGLRMVEELTPILESSDLSHPAAKKLATLWLQNVVNMPLILPEDTHIKSFCHQTGLSESELTDAADSLDLNIAVLDDLLMLLALSDGNSDGYSIPREKRSKEVRKGRTSITRKAVR